MSRAYRVRVRESVRQTIRAEDHVGTTLELLEVLPREEMADLLRGELLGRGFRAEGDRLVRREGGLTIAVDPATSAVYVGTFHGVFRSADQGKSWTAMRDGLLNQDVRALVIGGAPPRLWAGTAGGSVYSIELP